MEGKGTYEPLADNFGALITNPCCSAVRVDGRPAGNDEEGLFW